MTQQTFSAGSDPHVMLSHVHGDVRIRVWDEPNIAVTTRSTPKELHEEGGNLALTGCDDDVDLHVPAATTVSGTNLHGDVAISGVRQVELTSVHGDVDLAHISDAAELSDLAADLDVTQTATLLVRGRIGGDVTLSDIPQVEIEAVSADLTVERTDTVVVGAVGGDLEAEELVAALRCGGVEGDCEVQDSPRAEITISNVGGDLEIDGAAHVHVSRVAGECDLHNVAGAVQVVHVESDLQCAKIDGTLQIGDVGGDADLRDVGGNLTISNVGSDLSLSTAFPPDSHTRCQVGGDARIVLPPDPHLTVQATVRGEVRGQSVTSSSGGNQVSLTYGEGTARLELVVEGDLDLRSAHGPSSSASTPWDMFGRDIGDLGRELGKMGHELGREMGKMGQDLGREFSSLFGGGENPHPSYRSPESERSARTVRKAERHARRLRHKAERRARHAHRHAHRAGRRARHAGHHAAEEYGQRVRVRFNDREWWLDPERLERIKDQARRAATEGFAEALEAVERAMSKLHVPPPPAESSATPPETPPEPPQPPRPATGPTVNLGGGQPPATGPTVNLGEQTTAEASTTQPPADSPTLNPEQEREAILRMVAEGRITPEEGDLLLEALDS